MDLRRNGSVLAVVLALAGMSGVAEATTGYVYVNLSATGSDSGLNWEDAHNDSSTALQDALTTAAGLLAGGDDLVEIWVAEGTYKPTTKYFAGRSRSETFLMIDKVHLYGGFDSSCTSSTCTSLGDRSTVCNNDTTSGLYDGRPCEDDDDCPGGTCGANATILSGDIAGNGSNKAFHVVTYDDTDADVTIDGFVIRDGDADGNGPGSFSVDNQGGGVQIRDGFRCIGGTNAGTQCDEDGDCDSNDCDSPLCLSGGPTLRNCLLTDNTADDHGGAVNDHASSTTYDNCAFIDNTAKKGGAILVDNGSADFDDCLFESNNTTASPDQGGAVWLQGREDETASGCPASAKPTVTNCVFAENAAGVLTSRSGEGGALWAKECSPTISGCDFTENEAGGYGGAVWMGDGNLTLKSSELSDNEAQAGGGGLYITVLDTDDCYHPAAGTYCALVRDVRFLRNVVDNDNFGYGGGMNLNRTNARVENCEFTDNLSSYLGGGYYELEAKSDVINCIFVENTAGYNAQFCGGGAAFFTFNSQTDLINATVVENQGFKDGSTVGCAGAVYCHSNDGSGALDVRNSILWSNSHDDGALSTEDEQVLAAGGVGYECTITIDDSLLEGKSIYSSGNIDDDPNFFANPDDGADNIWGTSDDGTDLQLDDGSPCGDAGDNAELLTDAKDIDGDENMAETFPYDYASAARVVDEVDMGAYEDTEDWCDTASDCEVPGICWEVTCNSTSRKCGTPTKKADETTCGHNKICCNGSCITAGLCSQ